jgi:diacylglycerol kinase (ATP)
MRLCLITNPGSGSAEALDALRPLLAQAGAEEWPSTGPSDTPTLAEGAARTGRFDAVVACGGDGTINEVVNGLMAAPAAARPALGILPLGTGNDLARTLALPPDHRDALAVLLQGRTAPLDVFHLKAPDADRYGVNVAAGGFSGAVGEALSEDLKKRWGPLAYLIGAMKALPELTPFRTTITLDDAPPRMLDSFNVFVANGRYVAGGKLVDPDAEVGDGLLDVVVVKAGTAADMAALAARFVAGQHHGSPMMEGYRARTVRVESEPGMLFNVDGELVTQEPITFTLHPAALRVVVPG